MNMPRATAGEFLDLADVTSGHVRDELGEDFLDPAKATREYAIAEAEERGLWCFVTRQDDLAWLRLTRLERNAMFDAIQRAHKRR